MIAERNPQIGKAVVKLRELSADERARDLYERREKARRDMVAREKWARQQGVQERNIEIIRSALLMNMSIGDIVKLTGLNPDEIESLRTNL